MASAPFLRLMTIADLPSARQLWGEAEGVELAEGDSEPELIRYLSRNPGQSYVAVQEGKIVGALLAGHDGRRGYLYHLAVAPGCRGLGLGRQLVAACLAALKADGVLRVLILVTRNNHSGREFWRRLGWDPLDEADPMGLDLVP